MRRFLIAYGVWNRADMVGTMAFGIVRGVPTTGHEVLFVFDHCADDSVAQYERYRANVLDGFTAHPPELLGDGERDEARIHNRALRVMLDRGLDGAIVFQEDHIILGKTITQDFDRLLDQYGARLGVVGGRDGFTHGSQEMVGSAWSESNCARRLATGEFAERPLSDRGPVFYPRHVVERIGLLAADEYDTWFTEIDYCNRAREAGFVNGVMGTDLAHFRWGRGVATDHYTPERQDKDWATMKRRWPGMHQ